MNETHQYAAAAQDWNRIRSQDWIPFQVRNRPPDPSKSQTLTDGRFVLCDARGYELATYRIRIGSVERLTPRIAIGTRRRSFQMVPSIESVRAR